MTDQYYETIADLEKRGVARDYIVGWASGFLGSSKKEEQRITAAYTAGYEDGVKRNTAAAADWATRDGS